MSNCSCYSNEGRNFWTELATKYEQRIQYLTHKNNEVRRRLETMQLQMPAYFCQAFMQATSDVGQNLRNFVKQLKEKSSEFALTEHCNCDPCPVKIPANFPENLYDYKYPPKPNLYITTRAKPKEKKLKKDCSCNHCAERVMKLLQAEKKEEADLERKPSVKRICQCDICRSMIPERLCTLKESTKNKPVRNKVVECACQSVGKEFKDQTVCECSICAEEVLKRIQSPDVEFEPFSCGCDGISRPIVAPTDDDIPICKCDSCKAALNKRLGVEKEMQKQKEVCFCETDPQSDKICDCNICAERLQGGPGICDCSKTATADVPICNCNTCKRISDKKDEIDYDGSCICRCEVCNAQRAVEIKKVQEEKEASEEIRCICNCEICNAARNPIKPTCLCLSLEETSTSSGSSGSCECSPECSTTDSSLCKGCIERKSNAECPCDSSLSNSTENSPMGSTSQKSQDSECPCNSSSSSLFKTSPTGSTNCRGYVQRSKSSECLCNSSSSSSFGASPTGSISCKGRIERIQSPECSCSSSSDNRTEGSSKSDCDQQKSIPECACSSSSDSINKDEKYNNVPCKWAEDIAVIKSIGTFSCGSSPPGTGDSPSNSSRESSASAKRRRTPGSSDNRSTPCSRNTKTTLDSTTTDSSVTCECSSGSSRRISSKRSSDSSRN